MLGSWAYVRGLGRSGRYEASKAWAKASAYARSLRALCESYWDFPFGLRQANPAGTPHSGHWTENAPLICHLPLLAGELVVLTHAGPSHVAPFAHMVLSIAPAVASTSASYVRLTPRFADAYIRRDRRGGWGQQRLFVTPRNKLRGKPMSGASSY